MIRAARLLLALCLAAGVVFLLSQRFGGVPPIGTLLDPADGLYRTARRAPYPASERITMAGLEGAVSVVRDARGVPHIFAESDRDAIIAFGYVTAQDRLFQMDFTPRVAAGRLAEVMGAATLETDRYLRQTGMELGARRNLARIMAEDGIEKQVTEWFCLGVNAYTETLGEKDLPFEFRLLGYRPERYTPLHILRLIEYMTLDLTYGSDEAEYGQLLQRLGSVAFAQLYPANAHYAVPIIPEPGGGAGVRQAHEAIPGDLSRDILTQLSAAQERFAGTVAEGAVEGKGSNNWAVDGQRSATGAPLIAGDPHLNLSLPSIWYEVHLVTPTMNTYGVTIPGAPLPVIGYNDRIGWTFTNTGSDQIDHYALTLDEAGTHYLYEGVWRPLEVVPDTFRIAGGEAVVDTAYFSHWGPVVKNGREALAVQWTGHEPARTLQAIWGLNHASDYADFEAALRFWDAPMQNVLYGGADGTVAIWAAGKYPIRKSGIGAGLLDGSTDANAWTGYIPFEDLPHSINPAQGYLSSTNQQPTDSLYPFYLGFNWRSEYRSIRIDSLLSGKARHSVADFQRYQADVHAVQRDFFGPLIAALDGLSAEAAALQRLLAAWDGDTSVERPEPLVMYEFLDILPELAWDEPAFAGLMKPGETVLYRLLREEPDSRWLDIAATPEREDGPALLRRALEQTADSMEIKYGGDIEGWRWGDHHSLLVRHLTRSDALRPLGRGPIPHPGFNGTLAPAGADDDAQRKLADGRGLFGGPGPGWGVYPGGASGNPFSRYYDFQLADYAAFSLYPLDKPATPEAMEDGAVSSRLLIEPGE